jgi:hypothetical protein
MKRGRGREERARRRRVEPATLLQVLRGSLVRYLAWKDLDIMASVSQELRTFARGVQGQRARARYPLEKTDELARQAWLYMEQVVSDHVHSFAATDFLLPSKKYAREIFLLRGVDLRYVVPVRGTKVRLSDVLDTVYKRHGSILAVPELERSWRELDAQSEEATRRNRAVVESHLAQHFVTARLGWESASLFGRETRHHLRVSMFVEHDVPCDAETVAAFAADVAALLAADEARVAALLEGHRKESELAQAALARGYAVTVDDLRAVTQRYVTENLSVEQGIALLHLKLLSDVGAAFAEWQRRVQKMGPNILFQ